MNDSVFFEFAFLGLVASSLLAPSVIFGLMMWRRAMSRITVLLFGVMLILLSGVDGALLVALESAAKLTPSLIDDRLFASEISIALYVLPAVLAGIGTNIVSQLLIKHLEDLEREFDREQELKRPQTRQ